MGRERQMQTFDSFASQYDKWFETGLGKYVLETEMELTLKLAEPKQGEKVLDIGVGTGIFACELMRYGADITGIDVSDKMLEIAKSKGVGNVLIGNAESLDFADEAFDLVISITALEFIKNPEIAISEMVRVCKKGGRVVVGTLGSESCWASRRMKAAKEDPKSVFRDARFYSFDELKQMAEKTGYRTIVKGAVFAPPHNNAFCVFMGKAIEKLCQAIMPSVGAFLIFRIDKN
jgi:ubiquinone/menaquinone biosynthesis C-methylase UbiE